MYSKSRGVLVAGAGFLFAVIVSYAHFSIADTDGLPCDNPRLPTSAEVSAGAPAGVKGCPSDFKTAVLDSGQAKQYLRSILCPNGGDYGGAGPDTTIRELNPEFASCAAKFLRFAQQNGISLCINEGYRTPQKQNQYARSYLNGGGIACTHGAQCEHPRGIAIDVNSNNYPWLWNNGCQFGIDFYLRSRDQVHFVPLSHSRARRKSTCGSVPLTNCFDPNFSPQDMGGAATPLGLGQQVRNMLSPQQEQMCPLPGGGQVPCSSIANRGAQQPLAQGQQPQLQQPPQLGMQNTTPYAAGTCPPQFYCSNSTYYYRSSTCVDQVYQKCPAGCSASSNTCASTTTGALSAIDQIGLIAEPTSTPSGTVSDLLFELAISGEDIATLQDESNPASTKVQGGSPYMPPASQQTFVSGDLRYGQAEYQPQQLSALQRTLATMKDTLLRVLAYLRPFGRPVPVEGEYDEWAE